MTGQEFCAPGWGLAHGERSGTTNDDDGELVARFQRGETRVFDSLFVRHQDYVYRVVYGIVGSVEEARDVTQEVFVQAYRALPGFRRGARFGTWLYRIAVNRAVDAARGGRKWRFLPLLEEPSLRAMTAAPEQEPEALFERRLAQEEIQAILMRCSLAHRQTLVLRYYKDMSLEEIAQTLDCSLSAAKVRLHRARLAFKAQYVAVYGQQSHQEQQGDMDADVCPAARRGSHAGAQSSSSAAGERLRGAAAPAAEAVASDVSTVNVSRTEASHEPRSAR